ncbi:MAG: DNA-binding domain-containing protein [Boseongicola sp.]|nr:DNA-binding domain-containing protein [Boseongicola sp.]MDD9977717.1 DNA-binding domain-containing protein [Boseongicola sp.]
MTVDQTDFRSALLTPDLPRPAGLSDGQGRPAGRRFDVYRNNVAVSLTEALETAFPAVAKLVGEQNFKLLAGAFLRKHPPSSPLMMFYGQEMPEFLASFEPTRGIGYLPDVARLELAIRKVYHAADAEPFSADRLQTIAPEILMASKVELSKALQIVSSNWPVLSIWEFNMVEGAAKPEMVAQDVIVVRADLDPEPHLLPPGAATFLAALQAENTLGDAYETAMSKQNDFDLSATLALLLANNAIIDVKEDP